MTNTQRLTFLVAGLLIVIGMYQLSVNKYQSPVSLGQEDETDDEDLAATNIRWRDCDNSGSRYFTLNSLNFEGSYREGSSLTLKTDFKALQTYTHVSTDVEIKWTHISVFNSNMRMSPKRTFTPGQHTLAFDQTVPQDLPEGPYTVISRLKDEHGKTFQCLQIQFDLYPN